MTGDILPQNVKLVFHEFCNCCEYLELVTAKMTFTADNRVWNEYATISCEHYDACERVYDICKEEG